MTGYVITTEIDGGACLSRSVACVSQNKLPKLSQCVQVFEWRNSLPRLALLRWPVEWICSRRRSCQRSRLPRTEQKDLFGGWNFFFASAPFLVLEAFRGHRLLAPTTTCSLGASRAAVFRYRRGRCASLLLGCPPGPLVSWVPCGAGCLGAFRTRSCLGCPAGPAAWVPPEGTD